MAVAAVAGPAAWGQAAPVATEASAQPPASNAPTVLQAGSTLVLVPVTVRTKANDPVFTLTAKDFLVTDDGVEQSVQLEDDSGAEPLALVVVVETGGAGAGHLEDYRTLSTMVEQMVSGIEQHEVAVVDFDSEPELLQGFTPDMDLAGKALNGLEAGDDGAAVLDALGFAVTLLRHQPTKYRRAILLVSETVDQGSKMKLNDAVRVLTDTNTAIYSVGFSSTRSGLGHEASKLSDDTPGPPGGCMSRDPDAVQDPTYSRAKQTLDCAALLLPPIRLAMMAALVATNALKKNVPETVAALTGGEYVSFKNAKGLEKGVMAISNNLPNRYVLRFSPVSAQPGMHVLGVKLRDPAGLVVTARGSYWADPTTH